jgi:hypothetical protein
LDLYRVENKNLRSITHTHTHTHTQTHTHTHTHTHTNTHTHTTAEAEGDQWEECVDGPEGLTLIDARNGFNELSRYPMLWTARHHWPKGARFAFNCYRHYARCLVRCPGGEPSILLSREGVTQGCPQSRILYGLGLLPLAEFLRRDSDAKQPSNSTVLQPWYASDLPMMGASKRIA